MATTMRLIAKQTLSSNASSVTFSDIPQTYTDLYLVHSLRNTRTGTAWDIVYLNPNGSNANGTFRELFGNGSTAGSGTGSRIHGGFSCTADNTSNTFGSSEIYIPNYTGSTNKSFSTSGLNENNGTSALIDVAASLWSQTAAITSLVIESTVSTNPFVSGSSFFLYGITKA